MKLFYIVLLCVAYCAHGKFLPISFLKSEPLDGVNEDATKAVTAEDKALTANEKPAEVVQHPKLIVTLVANTRNMDYPSPFYVDPFQRFLQLFLSPFIRDLNRPMMVREEERHKEKSVDPFWASLRDELKVNGHKAVAPRQEKDVNSSELDRVFGCGHGVEGFCKDCHPVEKRETGSPAVISTSATVETSTCSAESSTQSTVKDLPKSSKHKRHYFLFVSGDTGKRVTAPKASEQYTRFKRDIILATYAPNLTKDEEQLISDTFKIKGGSAKRTTRKHFMLNRTIHDGLSFGDHFVTHSPLPYDLAPHRAEVSAFMSYFMMITVPMGCVFGGIILFLCVFLRTAGWCCSLFLKDSSKILEEVTAREAKKMMRKQFKKMAKNQS